MSTPAVVESTGVPSEVGDAYLNFSAVPAAESSPRTSTMSSHTFRRPRSAATRGQQVSDENVESSAANAQNNESSTLGVNENSSAYGNSAPPTAEDVNLPQTLTPLMRMKLFELATSSSESEGDENQQDTTEGEGAGNDARRAASPPPNCAICLGRCKNKCFTDSCMHQFCFKCLCEWSKVKPECPLCKQTFKSIIHNVKSIDQFEEYHVQPPTVQIPHRPMEVTLRNLPYIFDAVVVEGSRRDWELPRRRNSAHRIRPAGSGIFYPSPMSDAPANGEHSGSSNVTNMYNHYRNELLDIDAIGSSGTLSQLWRRFIYDRRLFALPVCDITGRFRESTARFYRDNPAQVHRLMPWINRDIVCLLHNTEHDVSTLLERINESLLQTNILSPAFRRRLQPYLGSKTSHFIHELNNFARSPYDMIGYDRAVHYLPQSPEEIVIEFSSSGSSDEGIASTDNERSTRSRARSRSRARNDGEFRVLSRSGNASGSGSVNSVGALLSFTVSATSEGTEAPGVTVSINGRSGQSAAINLSTHNRVSGDIIDLDDLEAAYEAGGNEAASTSTAAATTTASEEAATTSAAAYVTENIELTSSSSDECEFVLERKPPHLRTPELVSLNSESDSDVVFVDESKPLRKSTFASSGDEEQKQRQSESKNKRSTPQTATTTAAATEITSHTAGAHEELYNVGASTSTGLRSSGGGRGIKEMYERTKRSTASRRKRNLRSNRAKEDTQVKIVHRGKRIYESSCTPSNTDSSTSSSDSDSDEDFSIKRQRVKSQRNSRKAKPKSSKRKAKHQTRSNSNTRSRNNSSRNSRKRQKAITSKEQKLHSKRCKVEMNTDSEYSSDDGQNLIELQRRLQALKEQEEVDEESQDYLSERERGVERYNSNGYNNGVDHLPTGSSQYDTIQTQQSTSFTKQEHFDSDTNENSVKSNYALDRLVEAAEQCFGVAQNVCVTSTNEDQAAALNIALEEDNTFSSTVTQTTTATTVTTTAANNRSVSRASATTNNTNEDNDNDNDDNDENRNVHDNYNNSTETSSTSSSTSSSDTTASSPSLYSATSDGEEDDEEEQEEEERQERMENNSTQCGSVNDNENETDGNSLGLQQLLDGASLGDDWLVQHLGIDEESGVNHENSAVNENSDTEDISQQQVQVEEVVSLPDIENDVSSIFLNQHDSNLVMPFNYDAEGSQSDAE